MQEHHLNLSLDSTETEDVSGEYFNTLLNDLATALEAVQSDEQTN